MMGKGSPSSAAVLNSKGVIDDDDENGLNKNGVHERHRHLRLQYGPDNSSGSSASAPLINVQHAKEHQHYNVSTTTTFHGADHAPSNFEHAKEHNNNNNNINLIDDVDDDHHKPPTPNGGNPNFEDVIAAMGPPGRYQVWQCLLLSINYIPVVFINMNFVFIALEPPFSCSQVNETALLTRHIQATNHTELSSSPPPSSSSYYQVSYEDCHIQITSNDSSSSWLSYSSDVQTIGCSDHEGYNYEGRKHVSFIAEWDLVCDSYGVGELSQALVSVGWFFGMIVFAIIADKYGRRKTIAIASFLFFLSELASSFAPNISVFTILRFFSGFVAPGIAETTYVIGAELLASKYRERFTMYIGVVWSLYSVLMCGIAYFLREESWRLLQLCTALSGLLPLVGIYFVDESASWLYSVGNYDRATGIIKKACRVNDCDFNKVKVCWDSLCSHEMRQEEEEKGGGGGGGKGGRDNSETREKDAKDYNILDIFRSKGLRFYTFIAWFAYLTHETTYYGMILSASTLAGDLYLNTTLMSILELPGCIVVLGILRYKGRKFVMIFFMIMAAVCLIVSTCLGPGVIASYTTQHIVNASTAFFLLGKFAIGNSFNALVLYIPEIYPTTLRSSGLGLCGTGACIGGVLAPYVKPLHHAAPWAPGACLAGILTVSLILMFKLPETKGKQLPSTI